MNVAVVGRIEWARFYRVDRLPNAGEIVHADEAWEEVAGGLLLHPPALGQNLLNAVKQCFIYYRGMLTLVDFASIGKMSIVKDIGKHMFDSCFVPAFPARRFRVTFGLAATFGRHATGKQKVRDIATGFVAVCVHSKTLFH